MIMALDGPTKSGKLSSVGTGAIVEVKVGASAYSERKVVTLQGDGSFYLYFSDEGETPTTTTVSNNGFIVPKNQIITFETGEKQTLYVLAIGGTVDIRIAERA